MSFKRICMEVGSSEQHDSPTVWEISCSGLLLGLEVPIPGARTLLARLTVRVLLTLHSAVLTAEVSSLMLPALRGTGWISNWEGEQDLRVTDVPWVWSGGTDLWGCAVLCVPLWFVLLFFPPRSPSAQLWHFSTATTFSFTGSSWSWWYLGFLGLFRSSLWNGTLLPLWPGAQTTEVSDEVPARGCTADVPEHSWRSHCCLRSTVDDVEYGESQS